MAKISSQALHHYRNLADGLSDLVEEGRLQIGDIPDDYQWLVSLLKVIAGADPGLATKMALVLHREGLPEAVYVGTSRQLHKVQQQLRQQHSITPALDDPDDEDPGSDYNTFITEVNIL